MWGAMDPRLVFVHGIGGPQQVEEERDRWVWALAEGTRRAGHSDVAADLVNDRRISVLFAYYRDLFDQPEAQGGGELDLDEEEARILAELLVEVVDTQLAEAPPEQARLALAHAREQVAPSGEAQGVGELVRRSINAATTLLGVGPLRRGGQWVSGKLMVRDLAQVARYLARGEPDDSGAALDQRIRMKVGTALGDGPVIVVAHSLGTVVSLETLHDYAGRVPLLVTLGSPIAMRTVVWPRLVPQPPATPDVVSRWLNFWDRDDIIVARPRLEADVALNAREVGPESARIDSDGLWTHTATKYLVKPDVAGPIAETITRLVPRLRA